MIFYGEPNLLVRFAGKQKPRNLRGFRFDAEGKYETNNPKLIEKLKNRFKYEKETENTAVSEEIKTYTCKKCNESFTNKGLFLAHSRKCK